MSRSYNLSNSTSSFNDSPSQRRNAPIHNPYDKFTKPQFDAFIDDITGALRKALGGLDYEATVKNPLVNSPHDLCLGNKHELGLATPALELDSPSKGKGREREPAERPIALNGVGGKDFPIEIEEEEEDMVETTQGVEDQEHDMRGREECNEQGEEEVNFSPDDGDFQEYSSGVEEEEDDNVIEVLSDEDEQQQHIISDNVDDFEGDEVYEEEPDQNKIRDNRGLLRRLRRSASPSQVPLGESGSQDSTPTIGAQDASLDWSPFVTTQSDADDGTRTPLLVDPWNGVKTYAEDYYAGGDYIGAALGPEGVSPHLLSDLDRIPTPLEVALTLAATTDTRGPPSYDIFGIDEDNGDDEDARSDLLQSSNNQALHDDDDEFDQLYAEMEQEATRVHRSKTPTTGPADFVWKPPFSISNMNVEDFNVGDGILEPHDLTSSDLTMDREKHKVVSPEEDEMDDVDFHHLPLGTSELDSYDHPQRYNREQDDGSSDVDIIPTKKRVKFATDNQGMMTMEDPFLDETSLNSVGNFYSSSFLPSIDVNHSAALLDGVTTRSPAVDFGSLPPSDPDIDMQSLDPELIENAMRVLVEGIEGSNSVPPLSQSNSYTITEPNDDSLGDITGDSDNDVVSVSHGEGSPDVGYVIEEPENEETQPYQETSLPVQSVHADEPVELPRPLVTIDDGSSNVIEIDQVSEAQEASPKPVDQPGTAIKPPISADPNAVDPTVLSAAFPPGFAQVSSASGLFTPGDGSLPDSPYVRDDDSEKGSSGAVQDTEELLKNDLTEIDEAKAVQHSKDRIPSEEFLSAADVFDFPSVYSPSFSERSKTSDAIPTSGLTDIGTASQNATPIIQPAQSTAFKVADESIKGLNTSSEVDHNTDTMMEDVETQFQFPQRTTLSAEVSVTDINEGRNRISPENSGPISDQVIRGYAADNADQEANFANESVAEELGMFSNVEKDVMDETAARRVHKVSDAEVDPNGGFAAQEVPNGSGSNPPDPNNPDEDPFRLMGTDSTFAPGEVREPSLTESPAATPADEPVISNICPDTVSSQDVPPEEISTFGTAPQNEEIVKVETMKIHHLDQSDYANEGNDSEVDVPWKGIKRKRHSNSPHHKKKGAFDRKGKGKAVQASEDDDSDSSGASSTLRMLELASEDETSSVRSSTPVISLHPSVLLHKHPRPNISHPHLPTVIVKPPKPTSPFKKQLASTASSSSNALGSASQSTLVTSQSSENLSSPTRTEPPQRTASVSISSPVTRSNCRFRRISLPREEGGPRVYFILPGCSLGDRDLMEQEEIVDHGDATTEDGKRMIKDIENLDLSPDLVGILRQLVGVDLLREQEVAFLPQVGEELSFKRRQPGSLGRRSGRESLGHISGAGPSMLSSPSSLGMRPPVSQSSNSITASTASGSRRHRDHDNQPFSPRAYTDSDISDADRSPKPKKPRRSRIDKDEPELSDSMMAKTIVLAKKPTKRVKRLGSDAAAYKPNPEEDEDDGEEYVQTSKKKRKSLNRGLKRTRTADGPIIDAEGTEGRRIKKQKKRNESEVGTTAPIGADSTTS